MSTETKPNRLIYLISAIVVVAVLFLGIRSCARSKPEPPPRATVEAGRPADADGVDATVRTLTARLGEVNDLGQRQASQEQRLAQLESQIVAESPKALEAQVSELAILLKEIQTSQLALADRLAGIEADRSSTPPTSSGSGHGIPPAFGIPPGAQLSGADAGFGLPGYPITQAAPAADTWVYPLDHPPAALDGSGAGAMPSNSRFASTAEAAPPAVVAPALEPRYTVPVNATLLDARAMTALIGRIPVQGALQDPYPVKVVVGPEGLATNGLNLPQDLRGMVFSGKARGDWGLSCVRVELDAVTFTFEDGTIRTLSSEAGGEGETSLGYVSDAAGNPCIDGERITNAPKVLAARFAASAFEAAARGYAQAQTTSVVSGTGSVVTAVDDAARFGAYTGLAGGAEDAQDWLEERLAQSFDAIYAPPGARVAVHIQRALEIDFESNGRQLVHAPATTVHNTELD